MADKKYFPNERTGLIDEILRRSSILEQKVRDLERELANQDAPAPLPRIDPLTYPTPYEGQRAIDVVDEQHTWYSNGQWRKAGVFGLYEIKAFEDTVPVIQGDGQFWWPVPMELDGAEIVAVEAGVTAASTSGSVQIQIAYISGNPGDLASDILSTPITIEPNEYHSMDAATQPVISGGAWAVAHGAWLRIDIDAPGVDVKGLAVIVALVPSPLGSVTIKGAKGDPGGVNNWTGAWSSATTYATGDAVSHGGTSYVAIQGSTNVEPGVTAGWENYWMVLVEAESASAIEITIDGNGFPLDTGLKTFAEVPFDCTITAATLLAQQVGDLVIDVWRSDYGSFPPTDAGSITASSPPTLSSSFKNKDTALVGWTTSLLKGDILAFNIDSVAAIVKVTLSLAVSKI